MYSNDVIGNTDDFFTFLFLYRYYYWTTDFFQLHHIIMYKTTFSSTKTKKNIKKVSIKIVLYKNTIN